MFERRRLRQFHLALHDSGFFEAGRQEFLCRYLKKVEPTLHQLLCQNIRKFRIVDDLIC